MKRKTKVTEPVNGETGLVAVTGIAEKAVNGNGKKQIHKNGIEFSDELDMRELLKILSEVKNGNFSVRMPVDKFGVSGKICDTLNEIIGMNEILVRELSLAR